jgi:hypothetical protein
LRYGKEIKILDLFLLLPLEMVHRRIEIEKQDFRRKKTLKKGLFSIPISPRKRRNEKFDDYQL